MVDVGDPIHPNGWRQRSSVLWKITMPGSFTSPTTIVQVNRVNGIRADIELVDELERMWRSQV